MKQIAATKYAIAVVIAKTQCAIVAVAVLVDVETNVAIAVIIVVIVGKTAPIHAVRLRDVAAVMAHAKIASSKSMTVAVVGVAQ